MAGAYEAGALETSIVMHKKRGPGLRLRAYLEKLREQDLKEEREAAELRKNFGEMKEVWLYLWNIALFFAISAFKRQ